VATETTYASRFGGLWTDRSDAEDEIRRRASEGELEPALVEKLTTFVRDGYAVLEQAVPLDVVDQFRADISNAFEHGHEQLLIQYPGSGSQPLVAGMELERARVVDSYAFYESARQALFAGPIVDFFRTIFEADPLLFQSLSFHKGSQQGMHQDTAYVVVSSPLTLSAAWIALEDVQPGSGELMYYRGSHRLPEYLFSGEHKHWNPERDGPAQHDEWSRLLNENAERLGMERQTFLARKGDVLIWSADLAHGGSPVTDESLTRRSLVGHFCPVGVEPNYYSYRPDRRTALPFGGGLYSSEYYDLGPAEEGPEPAKQGFLQRLLGR
jgi:ectoine hydroxylase-related dioxygenase (phytanoyl-CoA dioxygenase family)